MGLLFNTNKKPAGIQKLRGGYYTPMKLARFLVKWAKRGKVRRVLEPSAGDGNFVEAWLEQYENGYGSIRPSNLEIVAVEIMEEEFQKGVARTQKLSNGHVKVEWLHGDFLNLYGKLKNGPKFDAITGNPPFIRFQYFEEQSRDIAFMYLRSEGYNPTKLANAWAAFVELCIELLSDGGR